MDKLEEGIDLSRALMLDGNAAAGLLHEVFGVEMTASHTECAGCGHEGEMGTLLAFTHAPGVVLRCPACEGVMVRIVLTPDAWRVRSLRGSLGGHQFAIIGRFRASSARRASVGRGVRRPPPSAVALHRR